MAAIHQAGGKVQYDSDFDIGNGPERMVWGPRWLVDTLGIDYFSSVNDVSFHKPGADEVARRLASLPKITTVAFSKSDLSDSGLARLRGLDLHRLILFETKVTDAGVRHVREMTNLELLYLDNTSVGDAAMAEIATLPRLELLGVGDTNVSDLGVVSIAKLPGLKFLDLAGTRVGDASAATLKSLSGLKWLRLDRSRITPLMIKQWYLTTPGVTASPGAPLSSGEIDLPPP